MYSFDSRVRYSEVNSEQKITLPALLDYLQDCCTFQTEELNCGVDYLKEHNQAWVLSSWEVIVNHYPKLTDKITINTWPYDFKNFYGYRNFTITDEQGQILAAANSVWVFMDTAHMKPVKISDHFVEVYREEMGTMLEHDWSERKIKIKGEMERKESIVVQKFHIDTNHHMNNSKYVMTAENYLPEEFETASIRVEYKKAAVLGDLLYPEVRKDGDDIIVSLADEAGKPYAVVSFIRR